jgi:hypothetical protein
MTDDRSLERAARSWLELGPTEAPDHAVDAALLRIQTTAQERDWRLQLSRRNPLMTLPIRLAAAAIAIAVVAVGGILILRPGGSSVGSNATPSPSVTGSAPASIKPSAAPSASPIDYSGVGGRILIEHAGNAPDGSEPANGDYHIDRRRFYWMDPVTMTGSTAVEFLPGQPSTGKVTGDISPDGLRIVFQDAAEDERIWLANLDGTALHQVQLPECGAGCRLLDPVFDPTGTKIAFVKVDATTAVLATTDLTDVNHVISPLFGTNDASTAPIPEKPSWSPDGTRIAFDRTNWDGENPTSVKISVVDLRTGRVTTLPIRLTFPGDPHWSPDGSRILLTDGPLSMQAVPLGGAGRTAEVYSVAADGSDLRRITTTNGNAITANYTPDGRVLYFNNYFWLVNADGTDPRPVNVRGDDLSEMNVGFAVVGHWINKP